MGKSKWWKVRLQEFCDPVTGVHMKFDHVAGVQGMRTPVLVITDRLRTKTTTFHYHPDGWASQRTEVQGLRGDLEAGSGR